LAVTLLSVGSSQLRPRMYWCVGTEESAICRESDMDPQNGTVDMGGKQSTVGEVSIIQTSVTESIQDAYKAGDTSKAQELIKLSCEETALQVEKCQLLGIAAAYGDLQAVRYLLKEALVTLPTEPNDDNAAVVAAYFGHKDIVKELLDSLHGPSTCQQLLNWMLAIACQQGHLDIVKLLIRAYSADPESCAVRRNEFPVLIRLPLYAAIKAGNEDVAVFLLRNGAFFCSYILMDSPESSKHLLRKYFIETSPLPGSAPAKTALCVNWSNLRLPWVDLDWLIDISCQITELDLSANCLVSLPSVIPWGLINLRKLSLADNQLTELPSIQSSDEIICTRLLEVDVSSNRLSTLPSGFLHLKNLKKLIASKNYMEKLFDEENTTNWIGLRKLQEFDVSDNRLVELPTVFLYCFKSLNILNVSRNQLKVFPDPWACPLKCCKASRNSLEFLPDALTIFWKNHLREVDFSENSLKEVPLGLFQLEALVSLKLLGNQLVTLPSQDKWNCKQLKSLDLSKNQLGKSDEGFKTKRIPFFTTKSRVRCGPEAGPFLEFPSFLSDSLEVLYLNDNQLDSVPQSVCLLKGLTELYLGNNPGIRELPPELGQLANLWQLDIEELNISNVPAEIRKEGPKTVLAYLRAQLRKAEKCKLMKMIIIGPPRQGKSTLIEILQTGKVPQMMHSDATIRTTKWELPKPVGHKAKVKNNRRSLAPVGCLSPAVSLLG
uniref:Leucine rich repeat kinase 1 n=1 Tax=Athene cunicularia TaxID=194338 RepID=A0A663MZZ0_ATHCN